ncbi:MAG: pantetheine-phosphate adenylyltransferase [Ignavibacteriales bacterium]|nr:pantetheine-phosphate adenylyltransferase [Ignavibacteriales bacterium]
MKIAIYPGTFDPITFGHIDVLERAAEIFDKVIVAVSTQSGKNPLFTLEERMAMVRDVVKKKKNVSVESFHGLLMQYAKSKNAIAVVRGLRAISDFEYEFQMALTNKKLVAEINTVFLMPNEKYTYLNSTIVREIALFGGDLSSFVPSSVEKKLKIKVLALKKLSS